MQFHIMDFLRREEGQDLAEYSLVIVLIAIVCVAALTLMGGNISTFLASFGGAL